MSLTIPRRRVIRRKEGADDGRRRRLKIILAAAAAAAAAVFAVFGTAAVSPWRAHVRCEKDTRERKEGRKEGRQSDGERERESGITGNKWLLLLSALLPSFLPSFCPPPYSALRRVDCRKGKRRTNLTSIHLWRGIGISSGAERSGRMEGL